MCEERSYKMDNDIEALKLGCKVLWNYVEHLCKIHANKSQESHDVSEMTIADLVTVAFEKIVFHLECYRESNSKINGIITESIVCWSVSEKLIATLPTPVPLIKEWVKIQYEQSKDAEDGEMLYSLLSSSKEISKKALGKLLEEELLAYDEKSYLNPRYFLRMKNKVINVLLQEIYITKANEFEKCRVLIYKSKSLRAHGLLLDECLQCLSDAISSLKSIYSARTSCSSRVHHLLIHGYILHALCTYQAAPSSIVISPNSDFLHHINDALNLCLSPDHGHEDDQNEDVLYLWYELIDLLSIKGYLEVHPMLYDVVFKLCNKNNFSLEKTLAELWKSKRLGHALCASPVNDIIMENLSKHQDQLCSSSKFWEMCMEEIKPLVVGFHHTNNAIKQAASDLNINAPLTDSSTFLLSNVYYDLSGRLISSGQMIEALIYAREASSLRDGLLLQKFDYSIEEMTETFDEKDKTITISYEGLKSIKVFDSVAKGSCDYEGCVLTPWNVLSCHLESVFQVGFVEEILGNATEAQNYFLWGRSLARLQGLTLFEISFSYGLGKLYNKQKLWIMAEKELSSAKKILSANNETISCKKCSYMLEIAINQQLGDLFLSSLQLSNAHSLYKAAIDKLKLFDSLSIESDSSRPKRIKRGVTQTLSCHCSLGDTHEVSMYEDLQIKGLCNNIICLHCLHEEAVGCSNLNNFMCMNWELVHRKLCLGLFMSIGKFFDLCGFVNEAHQILLQSTSVLFSKNPYCLKHSPESLDCLIESIGKHFPGDALAAERAELLYYICVENIESSFHRDTRDFCCELSRIETEGIVILLKQSFILCRDIPLVLQKVSRLLAVIYVLSTSLKQFILSPNEVGSESLWASFFHQASLGTQFNNRILYDILKKKCQHASESEDSSLPNSVSAILDSFSSIRPAPESCKDLDKFVQNFFQGLPSTPVVCISLVSGGEADLLKELLHCSLEARAWILISHLSSDNQHVILLPVHEKLEGKASDDDTRSLILYRKTVDERWHCPWDSSVIDDIALVFRHVLEANHYTSTSNFLNSVNMSVYWNQRNKLDECLRNFLQDMEDLWLDTWKYLLLGKWPDRNHLNSAVQEGLLKDDGHLLQLVIQKCYVGQWSEEKTRPSTSEFEKMVQLLFKKMLKTSDNSGQIEYTEKPIILVLDNEVQMLPWENLPILRNQEVYRMPSVGSIFALSVPVFPLIDPLDSYYLLNPDGDLSSTQAIFEKWFKNLNLEGKHGTVPTVEELIMALRKHDLFIYMGHGSGAQYINEDEFQELEGCAAALLMGCSSGALVLNGSYMPRGAPLSYILAGSPIAVATLWHVTSQDIDSFGKVLLEEMLRERSMKCDECNLRVRNSMSSKCSHRRRIGSFMGKARDACTHRFLMGAAPICYGVPTGIIQKKSE